MVSRSLVVASAARRASTQGGRSRAAWQVTRPPPPLLQVLARALGGAVGRNPSGRFVVGAERLELTRSLAQRRDFALARAICPMVEARPDPARYRGPGLHLLASHADCVLRLPEGADLLATSPGAAVELWALGRDVLAQQSHPELTPALLEALILPGLLKSGKISPQDAAATAEGIKRPLDNQLMLAMGRFFLHGEEGAECLALKRLQRQRLMH